MTLQDDRRLRVNLLLSHEHAAARIISHTPQAGSVVVETKRALELYIRIPPWCERQSLAATINGHAAGVTLADDYLTVGSWQRGVGSR